MLETKGATIIEELEMVNSTFLDEKETMKLIDLKDIIQINESSIFYMS